MADRPPLGLYVHIPFCVRKCHYCDFVAGPASAPAREQYVRLLCREIESSPHHGLAARTVFFGGGTPSELTLPQLEAIVTAVRRAFAAFPEAEWTIECNPGTVGPESLAGVRRLGFNRISLGVQSFHDHHLRALGRIHDAAEAIRAFEMAAAAGFDNRNLDLIFALPEQTLSEWEADLSQALALAPEHLSLYNLTIEKGTDFGIRFARGELSVPDEETAADMYELALDTLAAAGYEQYEISNFARPGRRCKHNQIYWRNEPYLGFGIGAASYLAGRRWSNTASMGHYRARVEAGEAAVECEERLPAPAAAAEAMMLAIRTADGVSLDHVSRAYGVDAHQQFGPAVRRFEESGLLLRDADRFRLTRRGLLLANIVCAEFLS